MSRQVKIIIFSCILLFSWYYKNYSPELLINKESEATPKPDPSRWDKYIVKDKDVIEIPKSSEDNSESFDIDSPDITDVPKTGDSPYDDYFGKGIYRDTKNYFIIHAPAKTHVVFILIDNSSGRRIRNEFIRKGEVFTMTKIPYGTYDYMYFTGRNWTNTVTLDKGRIRGGFMDYKSFKNNNQGEDQLKFKNGYDSSYIIKLSQTIGGNLKTKNITEDQFFN